MKIFEICYEALLSHASDKSTSVETFYESVDDICNSRGIRLTDLNTGLMLFFLKELHRRNYISIKRLNAYEQINFFDSFLVHERAFLGLMKDWPDVLQSLALQRPEEDVE